MRSILHRLIYEILKACGLFLDSCHVQAKTDRIAVVEVIAGASVLANLLVRGGCLLLVRVLVRMPLLSAEAFCLDGILVVRGRSTAAISTVRLSLNDILVSAESQRLVFLSRLGVNLFVRDQVFITSLAVWIERRHIVLGEGYFVLPL